MTILQDEIWKIVNEESGGIKMTSLLIKLVDRGIPPHSIGVSSDEYLNLVEIAIHNHPKLNTLVYVMDLGGGIARQKQFIYRREI